MNNQNTTGIKNNAELMIAAGQISQFGNQMSKDT